MRVVASLESLSVLVAVRYCGRSVEGREIPEPSVTTAIRTSIRFTIHIGKDTTAAHGRGSMQTLSSRPAEYVVKGER